jgi:hypothetical protein
MERGFSTVALFGPYLRLTASQFFNFCNFGQAIKEMVRCRCRVVEQECKFDNRGHVFNCMLALSSRQMRESTSKNPHQPVVRFVWHARKL